MSDPVEVVRRMDLLEAVKSASCPLQFLAGVWKGRGKGVYPTIRSFDYNEELTIIGNPSGGRPVLHYKQRSWSRSAHPKPMHEETGWIRVLLHAEQEEGKQRVEVVLAAQNGVTTVEEGFVQGTTMVLHSTGIVRSSTARHPFATEFKRVFQVDMTQDPPTLHYTMDMATERTPLHRHLEAWLVRQSPTEAWTPYSSINSPAGLQSPSGRHGSLTESFRRTDSLTGASLHMGGTSPAGPSALWTAHSATTSGSSLAPHSPGPHPASAGALPPHSPGAHPSSVSMGGPHSPGRHSSASHSLAHQMSQRLSLARSGEHPLSQQVHASTSPEHPTTAPALLHSDPALLATWDSISPTNTTHPGSLPSAAPAPHGAAPGPSVPATCPYLSAADENATVQPYTSTANGTVNGILPCTEHN